MAKYQITLGDGRQFGVFAPNEDVAFAQARHQEQTRLEFARQRIAIASERERLRALVHQYGAGLATQMLQTLNPGFLMPDLSAPDPASGEPELLASEPVLAVKIKD